MDSSGMFLQLKVRIMAVRELTLGSGIFFGLLRIPREDYRKYSPRPVSFRTPKSSRYRFALLLKTVTPI